VTTPMDPMGDAQDEGEPVLDDKEAGPSSGVDRRTFITLSLAATAAGTLGAGTAGAQAPGAAAAGRGQAAQPQQPPPPPVPLGNAEAPAVQFQPYPGGTGAMMERLARERGRAAFDRSVFTVEPWSGPVPASADDIAFLPAHRLAALIKERKITSARLTDIYLERLKRLNPVLLCAVTIMEDQARAEAAKADAEIKAGKYRGPLHGIPYGLKDIFSTRGVPTTWGAADFENRIIDEDAEVVARLRGAGAVLLAKLATGLFAQNDQWFRGRTNNPWNLVQGSSGSSAGPASATAAGCVAFSIGTETQGSIVSPSLRCGVSSLRPTFGRVSRVGAMTLAWSMDRVGPICRTVEDCAMVFNAIHGVDEKDPSTVMAPFRFDRRVALAGLRIGVDPNAPKELVEKLRELGVKPRDVGPRPTVAGLGGGTLSVEGAAAFDEYVQRKAKETGLDLTTLPEPAGRGGGGGRGGAEGAGAGRGEAAGARGAGGPGAAPANPMAPADWNPRFVNGRTTRAFEYVQGQRRRYLLVGKWAEYMKDLDMFIGNPQADVSANAQTGHPCVVVPYKFDVPVQPAGRGGQAAQPPLELKPQPIAAVIVGSLFADDLILAVAHQLQTHTDVHLKRPAL
jgi:Asp-tRNA(Asn)/Glu-tRNA(Gln) amidotransferase A subunit family amidase